MRQGCSTKHRACTHEVVATTTAAAVGLAVESAVTAVLPLVLAVDVLLPSGHLAASVSARSHTTHVRAHAPNEDGSAVHEAHVNECAFAASTPTHLESTAKGEC